jgi:two-component system OmpR family sensor kinase
MDEKQSELRRYAYNVSTDQSLASAAISGIDSLRNLSVELIILENQALDGHFSEYKHNGRNYLTLLYPFNLHDKSFLKVTKDITFTKHLLKNILNSIFIINGISVIVIIIYAMALSKMLIGSIVSLSRKIARIDENSMTSIDTTKLPIELQPLATAFNRLINRIETFVKYQKELFIGTAHELKTPLAVMKLKSEVTLLKERSAKEYQESLKLNIKTINEMNKIVGDILNVGRQESAQFEPPVNVDIIELITTIYNDFSLLSRSEGKALTIDFEVKSFQATIQTSLIKQIIGNFLQNALKFTPEGKTVTLKTKATEKGLCIQVVDEGIGVDESIDHFAPFKRSGNKSGVGLGLFLAKGAADAMGAGIALANRTDGISGTIASLEISPNLTCIIPQQKSNK